jgi:hypothetical protein
VWHSSILQCYDPHLDNSLNDVHLALKKCNLYSDVPYHGGMLKIKLTYIHCRLHLNVNFIQEISFTYLKTNCIYSNNSNSSSYLNQNTIRIWCMNVLFQVQKLSLRWDIPVVCYRYHKMKRNCSLNKTNGLLANMESGYVTTCFGLRFWPSSGYSLVALRVIQYA